MAQRDTSTVLITGFGPFPGVATNATGLLVPRLARRARRRFASARFATAILPTEWDAGTRQLTRHLARARPALALHFGVSSLARGFVIETLGRNACRDSADAAGIRPIAERLTEDGPATRSARLPVDDVVARIAALGLPVTTSDDAGGYLCNAVLYHSLGHADGAGFPVLAGFVHLPADLGQPGSALSLDMALGGGLEIIAACLDAGRARA